MTKVDEACPSTRQDLRNIYRSKHLKKKVSLDGDFPPQNQDSVFSTPR